MKHNWEYKRLKEVCNFIGGGTPSKSNLAYYNGNIPWATVRDMNKFELNNTEFSITKEAVKNSATNILPKGMIVISTHVGLGKICLLTQDTAINQDLKGISFLNDTVNKIFFVYWYHSITNFIISSGRGATVKGVTLDFMKNLSMPVPPLEVQQQIVLELNSINEVIEDCRELLRNLDNLAQALFYDYFGDPATNPKGWEIKKLEDVCTLKSGDSSANKLPKGSIPYVKVGDMNLENNKYGIVTSSNLVDLNGKTKMLFPIGTTIFPKRGGAILTNKKRITKVPICCDLNIMGAIPQNIHEIYLYYFFLLKDFAELIDGSTIPQINNSDIYPLIIPVPPLSLQEKFASRIEQIDAQKKAVEETMENLQTLLKSRMDYWFN